MIGQVKMVLDRREREHEYIEKISMGDHMTLNSLRRCVLLKLYCTSNIRAQVQLLETLIHMSDHELSMIDLH